MRFSVASVLMILLAVAMAARVHAADGNADHNRFKWRDGAGNLHYSDALPPEAAKLGYDVVNAQGLVVKRVLRTKTAAELAAAKAALAKSQAEQHAIDASGRADQQMLSAYPAESDLKRAQQQKLEMLDQQIIAAQISVRSQEQVLSVLLDRAAETERNGKKITDVQAAELATARKQADARHLALERRQAERSQADQQFETETAHYRELKAKSAEAQQAAQ